jgi:hypothetical protein
MWPFSRIVGVLLVAAVVASSAGAQALMLPAAQNTHPAGCHGHALPAPEPAPLSYQCCIAGHNHAVPGNVFTGSTLLPYFGAAADAKQAPPPYLVSDKHSLMIPYSVGSPGSISLRI